MCIRDRDKGGQGIQDAPVSCKTVRTSIQSKTRFIIPDCWGQGINLRGGQVRRVCDNQVETGRRLYPCLLYTSASALLDEELVSEASLILVMSRQHREQLLQRFPAAAAKTFLLKEFAGIAGNPDVADPYGGTIEEYRQIYEELRAGIKKIVQILERSKDNEDSLGQ